MRADLDRLFGAMGAHADSASAAPPESVRRRGNRRRRNRVSFICATLVVAVGAAATMARADLGDRTPPAAHTPRPTASFTTLTPVGAAMPMPLGSTGYAMASVSGNRLFAVGVTEQHHVLLGARDLSTNQPLWPTVDVGQFEWSGLYVKGDAILVVGAPEGGTNPSYVVMVFDADTAVKRWEVGPADLGVAVYDAAVVVRSATERAVLGLDWNTGAPRWRIPFAEGEQPIIAQRMTTPRANGLSLGYWPEIADQRLYLIQTDGTVRVYLGNTGAPVSTLPNSAPRTTSTDGPTYTVYDDVLYGVRRSTEVWVADLGGGATSTSSLMFTAPSRSSIRSLSPCGAGQVCLIIDTGTNIELVAVDRATHAVLWRRAAPQAEHAAAMIDRILTDRGQLYDMGGQPLGGDAALDAFWVTSGSALILRRADFTDIRSGISVVGVSTVDGAETVLGQIPQVRGSCTQTTQLLVCPADDGVHVWRFAVG